MNPSATVRAFIGVGANLGDPRAQVARGIAALRLVNSERTTCGVEFRIVRLPAGSDPADVVQKEGADAIAALLNKQQPTGGGDPVPATAPETLGTSDGHAGAAMTQSEIDALKAKLYRCWNPPVAVREASSLVVAVRITLLPDGSLSGEPQMVGIKEASNPLAQVAIEAAIRAVVQCAPFGDVLKPENYALWNQIDFIFDPREMLGG